jgi:uncharacterized protein (TIGR03083 family)
MDRPTVLDALDLESSRFLVAVSSGAASLDTAVPTCPGWDVGQLVSHLGGIYGRVGYIVSSRALEPPDRSKLPVAPEGEALIGWFAEQRAAVFASLESADDATRVWNWTADSPGSASFWARRMAHETLIHRVDAELAQGLQPAQPMPEVAADTVTEFLELFLPRFEAKLKEAGAGSIHLHATDAHAAEWTLCFGADGARFSRDHERADVALRASAFELACWSWGRLPTDRLETFGEHQLADLFQQVVRA